jgi:hypothetical protein
VAWGAPLIRWSDDGAIVLAARPIASFLAKLFADSAYAGSIFHTALTKVLPNLGTEIVKRSDRAKGFVPPVALDDCRLKGSAPSLVSNLEVHRASTGFLFLR